VCSCVCCYCQSFGSCLVCQLLFIRCFSVYVSLFCTVVEIIHWSFQSSGCHHWGSLINKQGNKEIRIKWLRTFKRIWHLASNSNLAYQTSQNLTSRYQNIPLCGFIPGPTMPPGYRCWRGQGHTHKCNTNRRSQRMCRTGKVRDTNFAHFLSKPLSNVYGMVKKAISPSALSITKPRPQCRFLYEMTKQGSATSC